VAKLGYLFIAVVWENALGRGLNEHGDIVFIHESIHMVWNNRHAPFPVVFVLAPNANRHPPFTQVPKHAFK
jgi:hypothetical protein